MVLRKHTDSEIAEVDPVRLTTFIGDPVRSRETMRKSRVDLRDNARFLTVKQCDKSHYNGTYRKIQYRWNATF